MCTPCLAPKPRRKNPRKKMTFLSSKKAWKCRKKTWNKTERQSQETESPRGS